MADPAGKIAEAKHREAEEKKQAEWRAVPGCLVLLLFGFGFIAYLEFFKEPEPVIPVEVETGPVLNTFKLTNTGDQRWEDYHLRIWLVEGGPRYGGWVEESLAPGDSRIWAIGQFMSDGRRFRADPGSSLRVRVRADGYTARESTVTLRFSNPSD